MKIAWNGYANSLHSWGICAQNICRNLYNLGHDVHLQSTNGYFGFPDDLNNIIHNLENSYDLQLSYTAMPNFAKYFQRGNKNRFAIWNYEFTVLPKGHAKYHNFVDYILPSSNFSYEIFLSNKIPINKLKLINHGICVDDFINKKPLNLLTNKKFKILANIAQPHIRKNLNGLLDAYGKAFSNKDDVCLVLKVVDKQPKNIFEVSFSKIYDKFKKTYKNHAECLVFKNYMHNLAPLYLACDAVFTMSHAEAFWLPGLEGLAAGKIIISPRYGGQLDFLNDENSLLIDGKKIRAPEEAQYWDYSIHSEMFYPNINDAVDKLRFAYMNYCDITNKFKQNSIQILKKFSWKNIANEIIKLTN